MTAEQSSEDNDGHQFRATIGLAGGRALQRAVRAPRKMGIAPASFSPGVVAFCLRPLTTLVYRQSIGSPRRR